MYGVSLGCWRFWAIGQLILKINIVTGSASYNVHLQLRKEQSNSRFCDSCNIYSIVSSKRAINTRYTEGAE